MNHVRRGHRLSFVRHEMRVHPPGGGSVPRPRGRHGGSGGGGRHQERGSCPPGEARSPARGVGTVDPGGAGDIKNEGAVKLPGRHSGLRGRPICYAPPLPLRRRCRDSCGVGDARAGLGSVRLCREGRRQPWGADGGLIVPRHALSEIVDVPNASSPNVRSES